MLTLLVASTLAAFAGALLLLASGIVSTVAAIHLAFAAGIVPLILGAMTYFVPVLTRSRAAPPALRGVPLLALGAGWLAFFSFSLPATLASGYIFSAAANLFATTTLTVWIAQRAARALDAPHPGLYWYLAALLCLLLALTAILAMAIWPEQRPALRQVHLHLNTLGFVALTAIGTLPVLLPTVIGRADAPAARRLRQDLRWALAGTLLIAGSAWWSALAWLGLALWLIPLTQLAAAWWHGFRQEIFALHGTAPSLAAAVLGFVLVLGVGALHALGVLDAGPTIVAFLVLFLFPLVTGALSHLLPLWWRPEAPAAWHTARRALLARYGGLRALLFLAGGGIGVVAGRAGLVIAALGFALFLLQAGRALLTDAPRSR
jgi:hypothetical protein